jgi:hypothetical protein
MEKERERERERERSREKEKYEMLKKKGHHLVKGSPWAVPPTPEF